MFALDKVLLLLDDEISAIMFVKVSSLSFDFVYNASYILMMYVDGIILYIDSKESDLT